MYARVNTIFGRPDRIDAGIAHLENVDRSAVESSGGSRGLTTLVDRPAGVIVALSYWDEPAYSSAAVLTRARAAAVAAAAGDLVAESYEVVAGERYSVPLPGAVARMARVQFEPARVEDGLLFLREQVLPRLRAGAGLHSAEVFVDRGSGSGVLLTVWADEHGAALADATVEGLRHDGVEHAGVKVPRSESYVVVRGAAPRL